MITKNYVIDFLQGEKRNFCSTASLSAIKVPLNGVETVISVIFSASQYCAELYKHKPHFE